MDKNNIIFNNSKSLGFADLPKGMYMILLNNKIVFLCVLAVIFIITNYISSENSVYSEKVKKECYITNVSVTDNVNYHYECDDGKSFVLDHDIFQVGFHG